MSTPKLLSVVLFRFHNNATLAQAKWAQEKVRLSAFEAALLNLWDAIVNRRSLAASTPWFLDASLLKGAGDFFMRDLDNVRAQGKVFCTSMSEHCSAAATTVNQRPEDICRVIAQGMDSAWSLPEFGANDNSGVGGSSGSKSGGKASGGASAFSSCCPIVC